MVALFLITTITCSQALKVVQRVHSNEGLPGFIREEIIEELKKAIPTCPIKIKKDG